jgi:hypothetical protein
MDLKYKALADKRLVRHRHTRWFGTAYDAKISKPVTRQTRIPVKPLSTVHAKADATAGEKNMLDAESGDQPIIIHEV